MGRNPALGYLTFIYTGMTFTDSSLPSTLFTVRIHHHHFRKCFAIEKPGATFSLLEGGPPAVSRKKWFHGGRAPRRRWIKCCLHTIKSPQLTHGCWQTWLLDRSSVISVASSCVLTVSVNALLTRSKSIADISARDTKHELFAASVNTSHEALQRHDISC